MAERLESGGFNGCDYFGKLPDEVVIFIFTKLSSSSGNNTLEEDVKSLVQCSAVSKRFDALTSLVPTLFISHPSVNLLNKCCPQILNKFKHIRSLRVNHLYSTQAPFLIWNAIYKPHNYCLVLISCTRNATYTDFRDWQSLQINGSDHVEERLWVSNRNDTEDMFVFHHNLVSSIREHKMLERVVVANSRNPRLGNLTLEGDILIKLKKSASPNLQQVQFRDRSGYALLRIPVTFDIGYPMSNIYFNIIEWLGNAPDQTNKDEDDDYINNDHSIPEGLHFEGRKGTLLKKVLEKILVKETYTIMTANHEIRNDLLSKIN